MISATPTPERRLYAAQLGSLLLLLPLGLFSYGWTMRADVHWACPMAAQGVAILGGVDIYIAANLFPDGYLRRSVRSLGASCEFFCKVRTFDCDALVCAADIRGVGDCVGD